MQGFMRVNLAERRDYYDGQLNFGSNMCCYCRDEREKVHTGHSTQECENREADEADAVCKLICTKCKSIGDFDCITCGEMQSGESQFTLNPRIL